MTASPVRVLLLEQIHPEAEEILRSAGFEVEAVARALDPEGWRRMLPRVRAEAVGLSRQGKLVILRHNKPADPDDFKGVYRLRLPDVQPLAGDAP